MSTTYKQLYQKVFLRLKRVDGRALLAAKEAVNDAQRAIARVRDFEELKTWDLGSASTVDGQKRYHLESDLLMTRPKDVYSIKLMDGTNSRKLIWIDPRILDRDNPYPEGTSEQRSTHYTQRGSYIELIPIPDDAYTLDIFYSQWPLVLSADTDAMSFSDDSVDVIVALASEMAMGILDGKTNTDWAKRAKELLGGSVMEEATRPDQDLVAQPFNPAGGAPYAGEYWKDPFIRGVR